MTKEHVAETVVQSNANGDAEPQPTTTLCPSYLSQTSTPSRHLQDPTSSRKLLVLDLNGTLLLRPKRANKKAKKKEETGEVVPRIRPIYPRPYIPTFREYLSHPKTISWLDTMVWSSAQPPGVKSMVEKCFYTTTSKCLKGIWARDMFGLEPALYGKKTLTVKDLTLIWSKNTFISSPSLTSLLPESKYPFSHSSKTTILLDDSPRKAQLQPWNHICIKEYGVGMRREDLDVWTNLQHTSGKRKDKKKKKHTDGKDGGEEPEVEPVVDSAVSEGKYDETLLVIIGVLEAMKHESNVGAWIRNGSLLTGGSGINRSPIEKPGPSCWFDDIDVANGWASKGKASIHELGIKLVDGFHG